MWGDRMNEITFQRSPHDRKNPYVMISREMAQDKSISPKARGVLLYLLSLPDDWKIYHSQLQEGLGVGEDYLNSAMEELLQNGYAERTREKVKGMFQPYNYTIFEFKKCLPDRENRTGCSGPENPAIQSKHSSYEEQKKQQQAAPTAAAFSQSKKTEQKQSVGKTDKPQLSRNSGQLPIVSILENVDITQSEKQNISLKCTDHSVLKNAIEWATDPNNPPTKCLAASIKFGYNNKLSKQKPTEDKEAANKTYAMKYDGKKVGPTTINVLTKYVEIVSDGCQKCFTLNYDCKGFMDQFQNMLRKSNFPILKPI